MASRGKSETAVLIKNLEGQVERLLLELRDIEETKEELSQEEYEEVREEAVEQLKEVKASLAKMSSGDVSLVDEVNKMQMAIQMAISEAFRTPEVMQMFAKKQPNLLREKLSLICGGDPRSVMQRVEILMALRSLGDTLSPEELQILQSHAQSSLSEIEEGSVGSSIIGAAGKDIRQRQHSTGQDG